MNYIIAPSNTIEHSAKGTSWKNHKYLKKEGNKYIYKETNKDSSNDTDYEKRVKNLFEEDEYRDNIVYSGHPIGKYINDSIDAWKWKIHDSRNESKIASGLDLMNTIYSSPVKDLPIIVKEYKDDSKKRRKEI